ncbi:MAG: PAS domain S-box protein [Anaerolineae bacterium]
MNDTHDKTNLLPSPPQLSATETIVRPDDNLLRTLIDTLPVYIFVKDTHSRFVLNNLAHMQVLGATSSAEVNGKTDFDFFPPELAAQYYSDEQAVIQTGQPLVNREEMTITPQGQKQWLLTTKVPWRDHQGAIIGIIGASRDITERKLAEEALRESEAFNHAVLDSLPAHVAVLDKNGIIIAVNDAWQRFAQDNGGDPVATGVGANYLEVCRQATGEDADEAPQVLEGIQRVLDGSQSRFTIEYSCHSPTEKQWYLLNVAHLSEQRGGAVTVHINITERKQVEETLRASEAHNRALIAAIPDAILHLDLNGIIRDANLPPDFVSANPKTKLVGQRLNQILLPEVAQQALLKIQSALETGQAQTFEYQILIEDEIHSRETRVATLGPNEAIAIVRDVTERKKIEAALRESEQRYRQLFEGIGDAVLVYNALGQFLDCNEVACQLLGYSRDEFLRLNVTDIIHPEFHRAMWDNQQKLWTAHTIVIESAHRSRSGAVIPVEVNTHRVSYQGQAAIVAVVRDITERKRTEKALRESQRFIQRIADTAPFIIYLYDVIEHTIVYANSQILSMLGYTPIEMQTMGSRILLSLVHPDDLATVAQYFKELGADTGGSVFENEYRLKHSNGAWRWLRSRDVVFNRTVEGLPQQILGTADDITERKLIEEALAESERKYRELVENTNNIILRLDAQGHITFFNEYAQKFFDYSTAEVLGQPTIGTLVPEIESGGRDLRGLIQAIAQEPERYSYHENENMRRNGERVWTAWTNKAIMDEAGNLVEILCIGSDITARKQAEEALRESEARTQKMQAQLLDAIESLTEAFALYDSEDRLVLCNSKYREYYDLSEDLLIPGIRFEDHVRLSAYRGRILEAIDHEEVWVSERVEQHQHPQGTYLQQLSNGRWLQISERRTHDGGIVGVRTDITKLKQAEEEKARLIEAISQQREQLHALTGQLAEAQEIERRQLARELHDRVGQNLTALGLNLNLIRGQLAGGTLTPASIQARLDDSLALVEQTTECIRDVMADLRPPVLDDYGLLAALRWYGSRVADRAGFTFNVQGDVSFPRLSAPLENALFRIAQEALINAAKHALATQVTVTIELDDEVIRLQVVDNGHGFDLSHLTKAGEKPHWGILTMTERAEAVGGWFRIESEPQRGTQVIVEVSR